MSRNLSNQVAIVTGAGQGIGRACALLLAERGARVVAADLNEDGLAETVELITKAGASAHAIKADLGSLN